LPLFQNKALFSGGKKDNRDRKTSEKNKADIIVIFYKGPTKSSPYRRLKGRLLDVIKRFLI
jgi:hypothetical protein